MVEFKKKQHKVIGGFRDCWEYSANGLLGIIEYIEDEVTGDKFYIWSVDHTDNLPEEDFQVDSGDTDTLDEAMDEVLKAMKV